MTDEKKDEKVTTHEWILWEHNHGKRVRTDLEWRDSTIEVSHFFHNDGLPFSVDLHHLPMPSATFFKKEKDSDDHGRHKNKNKPHLAPQTHKEYSLFKKGIFPDWEDEHCVHGGCWYVRQYLPPALLDHYWSSLVRAVVDETLDVTHIAGIRIDDKSKGVHPLYKIEIWLDTRDPKVRDEIRTKATAIMLENKPKGKASKLKLHWRNFDEKIMDQTGSEAEDTGSECASASASEHNINATADEALAEAAKGLSHGSSTK